MEIRVLGTGSSGNCYFVRIGDPALLLECGIPMKEIRKQLGRELMDVEMCLISHAHGDHCKAWKDVRRAGIECFMSIETSDSLGATKLWNENFLDEAYRIHKRDLVVTSFPLEHDVPGHMGMYIESVVNGERLIYITDTMYSRYKFSGMTHLMIECNYIKEILDENVRIGRVGMDLRNRIVKSHMSLETVKEFLIANDLSRLQEIHLLHLSDSNSDEERDEREMDRKARDKLDEKRIQREDDNTVYWREAIAKMTEAVTASNALGYRLESTLQKTHDVHDDLSEQVTKIMGEIASLRLEISQRDTSVSANNEKMILMLTRMESALGKILTERIEENE